MPDAPLPDLALALAIKGALVLVLAAGAARLLRSAPAALRHGVWALAFGALVALPLLHVALPAWHVALLPQDAGGAAAPVSDDEDALAGWPEGLPATADADGSADLAWEGEALHSEREAAWLEAEALGPALNAAPDAKGRGLGSVLLGFWAFGALAVALRWASCWKAAHGLVGRARPAGGAAWQETLEHVRRLSGGPWGVRLLVSAETAVPFAWGPLRPAIVLPASAEAWGAERRAAVLAHELAHVARGDAWTQLLGQVAVALHWFNPLSWMAYAELLATREHACDDVVLRSAAVPPSAYAGHLLRLAAGLGRERLALAAVAPMARPAPVEDRIRQVLDPARGRTGLSRRARTCGAALALAVVLPLAAFHPVKAPAAHAGVSAEPPSDTHEALTLETALHGGALAAGYVAGGEGEAALLEAPGAAEATEALALSPALAGLAPPPDVSLEALPHGAPLETPVPAEAPAEARARTTLRLEGRLGSGGSIEVFGLNGPLEARPGTGDRYRVVGVAEGPAADRIRFQSYERGGRVVACAIFPGQDETCEPGRGPSGAVSMRGSEEQASVRWTLEVPSGVRLVSSLTNGAIVAEIDGDLDLRTTNGSIQGTSRRGDVSARTTNGAIVLDARGVARAQTTNGAIRAQIGAAQWPGELAFTSTNGAVAVTLPVGVSAEVDARTTNGGLASGFPLNVQSTRGQATAQGRLGAGGGRLLLRTTNGNISLTAPGQAARAAASSSPRTVAGVSASAPGAPPAPPRPPAPPANLPRPPAPPQPPAPPSNEPARIQAEARTRADAESLRVAAQAQRDAAQAQREAAQAQRETARSHARRAASPSPGINLP